MDDVFKIIFWGIMILSFIISLFGKKNKKQPPTAPPKQPYGQRQKEVERQQTPQKIESGEYDILQEIERMFKTETSAPTRAEQKDYGWKGDAPTASEHQRENVSMDTSPSKNEHVFTSSEHTPEVLVKRLPEKPKQKPVKVDPFLAKRAEEFERYLAKRDKSESFAASFAVREKLRHPDTVKEYIIISEILGKPVSLSGGRRTMRR